MLRFLTNVSVITLRSSTHQAPAVNFVVRLFGPQSTGFVSKNLSNLTRNISSDNALKAPACLSPTIALENSSIPKKKIVHKKVSIEDLPKKEGHFLTIAYATANNYDLKALKEALIQEKLYEPETLKSNELGDVVVATAMYNVDLEPREIFFFREGAVVFWNCSDLEASNVLDFVKKFERDSYPRDVVEKERELMTYIYQPNTKRCHLQESCFVLMPNRKNALERYTFSHAMAQSARLGAWEAQLGKLAAAVRAASGDMEQGGTAKIDKDMVVRKLGELFSLRHRLNVESDFLDIPDFYWEEEELERLYSGTIAYFTIPKRTRVLNERIAHCVELLQLLSSWASDRHHVRLEWMIIILILIEVCFELLHFFERMLESVDKKRETVMESGSKGYRVFSNEIEENMFQDLTIVDS